jgi:hypothetical protein
VNRTDSSRGVAAVDLGDLGLDRGAHVLLKIALRGVAVGAPLAVRGRDPALAAHLAAWCRAQGHEVLPAPIDAPAGTVACVVRGGAEVGRWRGAEQAGHVDASRPGAVVERPPLRWGLAARGATVEAGTPDFDFALVDKHVVWSDEVARLYAQAAAAQWDPAQAVPWGTVFDIPEIVENAITQVMTYLVENETAALLVPARFLARLHPHFREVMQLLAIQTADEARHIEVFTRRGALRSPDLGLSTAGGQASLKTLLDEPDFSLAMFLLSVLGEGSFLSLLWFLREHAPDPVTEAVSRLAAQDEARHVAFGLAHLARHTEAEPGLRARLAKAVERRHDTLRHTAGLNEEVFDALVLLAARSLDPRDVGAACARVHALQKDMDAGRQQRLRRLGFTRGEAEALSGLHTRNFM